MTATPEPGAGVAEYLRAHRTGVLATSGRSGAPQQTLIAYQYDGDDFAISVRGFSQKAKNLRRQPEASLAVIDGPRQLIVYGRVTIVEDQDEVLRLNQQRLRIISTRDENDAELAARLRAEERVILLLKPSKFYPASLT